jgi:hypothetical protein
LSCFAGVFAVWSRLDLKEVAELGAGEDDVFDGAFDNDPPLTIAEAKRRLALTYFENLRARLEFLSRPLSNLDITDRMCSASVVLNSSA